MVGPDWQPQNYAVRLVLVKAGPHFFVCEIERAWELPAECRSLVWAKW